MKSGKWQIRLSHIWALNRNKINNLAPIDEEGGETQYVTVLEIPPVDSAETAVKVAIAAKARGL